MLSAAFFAFLARVFFDAAFFALNAFFVVLPATLIFFAF